jgi:hypothetical protein
VCQTGAISLNGICIFVDRHTPCGRSVAGYHSCLPSTRLGFESRRPHFSLIQFKFGAVGTVESDAKTSSISLQPQIPHQRYASRRLINEMSNDYLYLLNFSRTFPEIWRNWSLAIYVEVILQSTTIHIYEYIFSLINGSLSFIESDYL